MSDFRRKILINSDLIIPPGPTPTDNFTKAITAINNLSGQKSILRKFDDLPYIWVLSYTNRSATTHNLYVFNLDGDILGQINNISSKFHFGNTINNYACIYSGTSDRTITYDVFQLTSNGLIKVRNSIDIKNWVNWQSNFMYIANDNSYHSCGISNSTYQTVFDYDITKNTVSRIESGRHHAIQWYHYDGSYFKGLANWYGDLSPVLNVSYLKREKTTNTYSNFNFSPSIPNTDNAFMNPLFNYKNRYEDLLYEVYARSKINNVYWWFNINGISTESEPTSLSLGNISFKYDGGSYLPHYFGMLSYLDENGEFHAYSYNQTTGLIDLMI